LIFPQSLQFDRLADDLRSAGQSKPLETFSVLRPVCFRQQCLNLRAEDFLLDVPENRFSAFVPENDFSCLVGKNDGIPGRLYDRTESKLRRSQVLLLPAQLEHRLRLSDRVSDGALQKFRRDFVFDQEVGRSEFHRFKIETIVANTGEKNYWRLAADVAGFLQEFEPVGAGNAVIKQAHIMGASPNSLNSRLPGIGPLKIE
jgi:hypothetical protein